MPIKQKITAKSFREMSKVPKPFEQSRKKIELDLLPETSPPNIKHFQKWIGEQPCIRCDFPGRASAQCFANRKLFGIFPVESVKADDWAVLPFCVDCDDSRDPDDKLVRRVALWFVLLAKYCRKVNGKVPTSVHSAMLMSMSETLGYSAKFEKKKS